MFLLAGFAVMAWLFGRQLRPAFLPDEDQGYVYVQVQLPNGASLQRTAAAAHEVEEVLRRTPGVKTYTSVIGFSLLSTVYDTYSGFFFVTFKPWSERIKPEEKYDAIRANLARELAKLPEANAISFASSAVDPGRGNRGRLPDDSRRPLGQGHSLPRRQCGQVHGGGPQASRTGRTQQPLFLPNVPQLFINVDRGQGAEAGRRFAAGLSHAAMLPGRNLRQLFQPLPAANGRSTSRRRGSTLLPGGKLLSQFYVRNRAGSDGAFVRADHRRTSDGARVSAAL